MTANLVTSSIPVVPEFFRGKPEHNYAIYCETGSVNVYVSRKTGKVMTRLAYQARPSDGTKIHMARRAFLPDPGVVEQLAPIFIDLHQEWLLYAAVPRSFAQIAAGKDIREQIEIAKALLEVLQHVCITDAQAHERRGNRLALLGYSDAHTSLPSAVDNATALWTAERAL